MPDLRESVNHLLPLKLPAQLCMYTPGKEGRVGVQVCCIVNLIPELNAYMKPLGQLKDSDEIPIIRAERLRLRNWLGTNLPIQWGKRLTRIEQTDLGVTAHFEDGSSTEGDILIGADGINSAG
jgi:hypothetical protein